MGINKDEFGYCRESNNMMVGGIPTHIVTPNYTLESKNPHPLGEKYGCEFYVSYNPTDITLYGDVTTALVWGQMENFYILKGDHREAYSNLIEQGFNKCLEYFKANISQINKNSEIPK